MIVPAQRRFLWRGKRPRLSVFCCARPVGWRLVLYWEEDILQKRGARNVEAALLFCAVVFLASIVQGISGFAFGLMVLMVFPELFGFTNAIALTNLMAVFLLAYNSYLYRKDCNWQWVPLGAIASAGADLLGIAILRAVGDSPVWDKLLGVIFVFMAVYLLWGQSRVTLQGTKRNLVIFAGLAGLVTGLFSVGGPFLVTFMLAVARSKEEYISTLQILSLFMVGTDVLLRLVGGMITPVVLHYCLLGVVFMVAGLLIARRLMRFIDARMLRRIVCVIIIIDGVKLLVQ